MLMKWTPLIDFINILQAAFGPIFLRKKNQSQTVIREKLRKALSYKKGVSNVDEIDTLSMFSQANVVVCFHLSF